MTHAPLSAEQLFAALKPNEQGLVPVIAQDHQSKEILMMAWMNVESLRLTLETRDVTYWSRSRQKFWKKGETSGHLQKLIALQIDCDGDALLALVDQTGPACHTGERSCFFRPVAL